MGDRVLMQCHGKGEGEIGPVIYGHWSGSEAPLSVAAIAKRMKGREGDVSYASARLLQIFMGADDGNSGFGVWNAPLGGDGKPRCLVAEDSHGDAGVILIDVDNDFKAECVGGYLLVKADGSIGSKYDEPEED